MTGSYFEPINHFNDHTFRLRKIPGNAGFAVSFYQSPGDQVGVDTGKCICFNLIGTLPAEKDYTKCIYDWLPVVGGIDGKPLVYFAFNGLPENSNI